MEKEIKSAVRKYYLTKKTVISNTAADKINKIKKCNKTFVELFVGVKN